MARTNQNLAGSELPIRMARTNQNLAGSELPIRMARIKTLLDLNCRYGWHARIKPCWILAADTDGTHESKIAPAIDGLRSKRSRVQIPGLDSYF